MKGEKCQLIEQMVAKSQQKSEAKKEIRIDGESLQTYYDAFYQGHDASLERDELLRQWRYWRERAMNFLVRREHSEVELRQKLRQRALPEWLLEPLIEWLYSRDYLSLERFAYSYAKNRADLGYGPIRVSYELRVEHQVPEHFINEAFREINWERAEAVAARKIRHSDPLKYRAALYRRGFNSDG